MGHGRGSSKWVLGFVSIFAAPATVAWLGWHMLLGAIGARTGAHLVLFLFLVIPLAVLTFFLFQAIFAVKVAKTLVQDRKTTHSDKTLGILSLVLIVIVVSVVAFKILFWFISFVGSP